MHTETAIACEYQGRWQENKGRVVRDSSLQLYLPMQSKLSTGSKYAMRKV